MIQTCSVDVSDQIFPIGYLKIQDGAHFFFKMATYHSACKISLVTKLNDLGILYVVKAAEFMYDCKVTI